jgi:hypothetical protein
MKNERHLEKHEKQSVDVLTQIIEIATTERAKIGQRADTRAIRKAKDSE